MRGHFRGPWIFVKAQSLGRGWGRTGPGPAAQHGRSTALDHSSKTLLAVRP